MLGCRHGSVAELTRSMAVVLWLVAVGGRQLSQSGAWWFSSVWQWQGGQKCTGTQWPMLEQSSVFFYSRAASGGHRHAQWPELGQSLVAGWSSASSSTHWQQGEGRGH